MNLSTKDLRAAGAAIHGEWQAGKGAALSIANPVTGAPILSFAAASEAQVNLAVMSARKAMPEWRRTSAAQRGHVLRRIAELVADHREHLAALQSLCNGKPAAEAQTDVSDVIATFQYYAGLCARGEGLDPRDVPLPDAGVSAELQYVPVGVAALIVPWNFPMVTTAWKLAPALAAGCTVVLKPSELTPLAEIALMDLILQSGLPPGVVNLVCGAGSVGAALVDHPGVAKVSFTGSNATGQRILQACGARMQRVSLELGGKSALIVLDAADLDLATELATAGAFYNAGQMCSATSRVLVARPVFKNFVERLVDAAQALRHGDPGDASVNLGPLISAAQRESVLGRIRRGVADGARLRCGGSAAGSEGFALQPTVFTDATGSAALWREEIFGPVVCVEPFDDDTQAAAIANDSDHGLVATVVSTDRDRALRLAAELEVGTAWVNVPQLIYPQTAWGGFKHSGLGRELGPWGLQAFQELRHVIAPRPPQ
ncbi:aldehyde dehydrogenase family protein [Variovorax sp. J22R133]|uniref:aldehyde dehydrogenase family protein n=1 Tax=Variovorax brevis TaxID=3053503 RepID=UPI002576441C|nr:aldehyde dehydrogenase family protein [Variovorax sp. J22R133]MDM0113764.1 aldehyde dehydrogenase family protein [Variovorax sp. J22R133]